MICFDISALDCNLLAGLTELAPVYDFVLEKGKGILLTASQGDGIEVRLKYCPYCLCTEDSFFPRVWTAIGGASCWEKQYLPAGNAAV